MEKLFNNLLLPVRFNRHSEELVEKAVHVANLLQCNLHLLHVITETPIRKFRDRFLSSLGIRVNNIETRQELYRFQTKFSGQLKKGQLLYLALEKGDPAEKIRQYIENYQVDMLLADQGLNYLPNCLADDEKSSFVTLSITAGQELQRMKNIVLPLEKNLALNKLRIAAYLAREFGSTIHLVAIEDDETMKKAFRILKDNTQIPVICKTLDGADAGVEILQYGKRVNADLVIANPQALNIWKKLKRRMMRNNKNSDAGLPILAVT